MVYDDLIHFRTVVSKKNDYLSVELMCLNPQYTFQQLLKSKPRSIIVTSGTLSPMDLFVKELGVNFGFRY